MVDRLTVAECFWSVEMWLVRCECIGNEAACSMTGMWKTVEDPGPTVSSKSTTLITNIFPEAQAPSPD